MESSSAQVRDCPWFVGLISILVFLAGCAARSPEPAEHVGATPTITFAADAALGLAVDTDGSVWKAAGGLYRSSDFGKTWHAVPIPAQLHPEDLREVSISPSAAFHVYAAGPGAGVLRSDEKRQTWEQIGNGLPSQSVVALAAHSFRPDTVFAFIRDQGIFRTEDGGVRWQKMDAGPPGRIVALAHSTLSGSMNTGWLYAATPNGPYLSMDCF